MDPEPSLPRYENLEAWQAAHRLAIAIYGVAGRLPATERYGLAAQLRRAAVSVPANIVEGSTKSGKHEYRRFIGIALGSLFEVEYLVRLSVDLGFLTSGETQAVRDLRAHAGRLLWGLYRALGGVRPSASFNRPEDLKS
jgi:four helix bundle protein